MPKFLAVGERYYHDSDSSWSDPFIEIFDGSKEDFIKLLKENIIRDELQDISYGIDWVGEIKESFPELTQLEKDKDVQAEIKKRRTILYYEKTKLKKLHNQIILRKRDNKEEYNLLYHKYSGNYRLR
jgi:hypothetical protein